MTTKKRILVAPLDWGLGHATRLVPVVNELVTAGFVVVLAADNKPYSFLANEFPDLEIIKFPSYKIEYSSGETQVLAMLRSAPKIIFGIWREHRALKKIVAKHKIDIVLSDNRFGLWNSDVFSIYMSHQIAIKMPDKLKFAEPFFYTFHRFFINKYNLCWIPDNEKTNSFSGDLSSKKTLPKNAEFIGILSRFSSMKPLENSQFKRADIMVVASGPEPQRSLFERVVASEIACSGYSVVFVRGMAKTQFPIEIKHNWQVFNHLDTSEMLNCLVGSKHIICRSGYSSIMDLATLGLTAILIPTPGQSEQEYLAEYLSANGYFYSIKQKDFSLDKAMRCGANSKMPKTQANSLLKRAIDKLQQKLKE